jgi:antitoxin HigA-1
MVNEMFKNGMRPVHPGEVLREDFLKPLGMSANALAKALRVPAPRINDVVRGRRGVSADTAMRLARYFGGDARSWLNLQTAYDLRVAEISYAKRVAREVSPSPRPLPSYECRSLHARVGRSGPAALRRIDVNWNASGSHALNVISVLGTGLA